MEVFLAGSPLGLAVVDSAPGVSAPAGMSWEPRAHASSPFFQTIQSFMLYRSARQV